MKEIEQIIDHIKTKARNNERKWDRAQKTNDKIRFGIRARMCKELLNEISIMLNSQTNVQECDATKAPQSDTDGSQKTNHNEKD